ncbi:hypothetical protein OPQ81_005502 [Rhizoctonia solani]|nr:hypothetical protein OPQ81_005502 [Rhizoctonia solani]
MIPNADPHSPPNLPVHLSSAGYPSTTPSSPITGAFGLWREQSDPLRSPAAAMGSFVNKAKAIWRGKRHSYQWGVAPIFEGTRTPPGRPINARRRSLFCLSRRLLVVFHVDQHGEGMAAPSKFHRLRLFLAQVFSTEKMSGHLTRKRT